MLINTGFVLGQLAIFQAGLQMHLGSLRTLHQSYTFVCILLLDNFHWQQTGMGLRNTSLYFISKTLASFLAVQNSSIGDQIPCSGTTKGSPTQIHAGGIWALPVRGGGGLNPCPDGFGQLFLEEFT